MTMRWLKRWPKLRYLAGFAVLACVAFPAQAENWVQIYSDNEIRVIYDADSVGRTNDGHVRIMVRTTYYQGQYPDPDSSISQNTMFYTRQQLDEFDCSNNVLWILGVWYLDYNGNVLGGSEGRSPPHGYSQGTVGGLVSQYACR